MSLSGGRGEKDGREGISNGLHTVSVEPDVGLELRNPEITTCAKIQSLLLNRRSHSGACKL